jgi:(4S)-4-hydroxy-5-phosphonooxypentane-2,3-dione isomerase
MSEELFVVVALRVRPGKAAEFEAAIAANAAASLRDEPGCLRFDVLRDTADPHRYLLYECYRDEEAFTVAHCGSAHFAAWRAVAGDLIEVAGQQVTRYMRIL